jgi:putative ABC transport system permease protein
MRIPLVAGEICRRAAPRANPTVMVNRSFANTYFAGSSPVGHGLLAGQFGAPVPPATILGIVADARETGLHRAPGPTVYWCSNAQSPTPFFLVRTSGKPGALAETVRRKLKDIEPTRSVFDIAPLDDRLGDAYNENRLRMVALGSFAVTAVALACIGLYGTLSYLVNIRRREIGLRLALGAGRGQILRRFLGQGVAISLVACVAGLGLSIAFNRALASMLYGVSSADPTTLSAVALIVLTAAALASLIPSVRGALVQPMQVLRDE